LSGLSHRSYANLGHIYTVDKRDVGTKIGKIADEKMQEIDKAIEISLGLKTVR
jgi:mRNA-degrading endonuclease toxin of MazEF toxin-antitoxin module